MRFSRGGLIKDKERKKLCLQIKESLGEIRENIKKLSELDSYRDSPRRLEVLSRTSIKDEHSITGNAFFY